MCGPGCIRPSAPPCPSPPSGPFTRPKLVWWMCSRNPPLTPGPVLPLREASNCRFQPHLRPTPGSREGCCSNSKVYTSKNVATVGAFHSQANSPMPPSSGSPCWSLGSSPTCGQHQAPERGAAATARGQHVCLPVMYCSYPGSSTV